MTKIGADDLIAAGATAETLRGLPRADMTTPRIHLVDLELTKYVGQIVETDLVVAGIGEAFHVPQRFTVACAIAECPAYPQVTIDFAGRRALLNFIRMTDGQIIGTMRAISGCTHGTRPHVIAMTTITELLALPVANPDLDGPQRDYREKIVALIGTLPNSNIRYRATGEVIAEPKRQRASMLIHRLDRLSSAADAFRLSPDLLAAFAAFQVPVTEAAVVDAAEAHAHALAHDLTLGITKIYGTHRERVLLVELLAYHSPSTIPWGGEPIKGTLDVLVPGDTGQGKTTQIKRIIERTRLGSLASGSTSSRAGVLYSLDSKVNDKRVLRWGAFPLAHGELLALDEAQNIPREQWSEFTTARSEGVLKVDRSLRAEHPSRVRLIAFANPTTRQAMAEFQYGIMAVHPETGFLDPQDLRRFDLVVCVAESDQTRDEMDAIVPTERHISDHQLRQSILWAWTRRLEHCRYAPEAESAIRETAKTLTETFGTSAIPLLITDAHEKVARLAFAFAAFLHSTDDAHELVIVTPVHALLAGRLIEAIYTHPNCAFDAFAAVLRQRSGLTDEEYTTIKTELLTPGSNREDVGATEAMLDVFLSEDDLPRPDLEAATGLGTKAVAGRIGTLRKYRLIQSSKRGYRKTARFVAWLRRWSAEKAIPNGPNGSNAPDFDPGGGVSP